ncbi:hypothetical protein HCD_08190 [Helicobacter cetorum MIT 99-5656]|uniref:Uncharacterized protein n=1 Tax=Helicobacter cetorum (strain ATCC BAA-540 / CCUG 52418 / MIT 99-5656) TaxID=1163745 RepID=I0EUK3_HELCM|nr:hypothetical protein HCD_08190 [Helicobacter cetorum MIT 99-5656]
MLPYLELTLLEEIPQALLEKTLQALWIIPTLVLSIFILYLSSLVYFFLLFEPFVFLLNLLCSFMSLFSSF